MRLILALIAFLLAAAAPRPLVCPQPAEFHCSVGDPEDLRIDGGIVSAERIIRVDPAALPLERPLVVRIAALASAEVSWNGRVIGRNGVPGETREAEIPGRYFASFTVPPAMVRPGDNHISVRLSAQHLWLPVRRPVHMLDIGAYETPELPGRSNYLPALLALGAIAAAFAWFAAAALGGAGGGARIVAALALAAMLQLLAEVSRAFVSYTYPWALARVSAIALLAAVAAVLIAAYAGRRFMPGHRVRLAAATALAAGACLVFIPWFDVKAVGALLAGTLALGVAAAAGIRRRLPGARPAGAASLVILAAMAWETTAFLDMAWHLIAAALLILLVVEQIGQLRVARAGAARAAALEERLRRAEEAGEPIVQLKDGARVHRVAQGDILLARGADDYCEVQLMDGRTLLVTTSLARLQATLPGSFVRVHKSFVVNASHVRRVEPRPGGGRMVALEGGATVPIGRSYAARVAASLS